MTEKTTEKKPKAEPKPTEPKPKASTQKSNDSSSSTENGSKEEIKRAPLSEETLKRFKTYVGQKWTGRCRWFNVSKGFGFIDPHFEEAEENADDVFVHQSVLQMEGFRSLDEGEEVEFTVSLGKNGLEASEVTGAKGAALRGSRIRPIGKRREKMIRCFKCGQLGFHRAQRCKKEIPAKACYHCHSSDHLVSNCPKHLEEKAAQAEAKATRTTKKVSE